MRADIPPPPDIEPIDDFAPIVFRETASGFVAMLGVIELGAARAGFGGSAPYWTSYLPGGPTLSRATSIEAAKRRLAEHLRDWFAACGHPLRAAAARLAPARGARS